MTTTFNFAQAMQIVLDGGYVRRRDWNRPSHIRRQSYMTISNHGGGGGAGRSPEMIVMAMKDGTFGPYTPSHCDMLADDWEGF